jgi:hypothetical protein
VRKSGAANGIRTRYRLTLIFLVFAHVQSEITEVITANLN